MVINVANKSEKPEKKSKWIIRVCKGEACKKKTIKSADPPALSIVAVLAIGVSDGEKVYAPVTVKVYDPIETEEEFQEFVKEIKVTMEKVVEEVVERKTLP